MSRGILAAVFVLLFAKTTTAEPVAAGTDLKPVAVTLVTCEYKGGDEAISGVIPRPGNYSYRLYLPESLLRRESKSLRRIVTLGIRPIVKD